MESKFLALPEQTRINAFNQIAEKKGITPFAVEKDWWITQTLFAIFGMEMASYIVFKGGTSLSKSWGLIERFSEDIDLAIDREFLGFTDIPKRKTNLRKKSGKFITDEFFPELQKRFSENGISEGVRFELSPTNSSDQDPKIINIYYPNIIKTLGYLQPKIQIEIGCRSLIEPFENRSIKSFVDEEYAHLDFVQEAFLVPSVIPERTFLEKIFLLHEEFQKQNIRVDRLSRHLYDLYRLYHSEFKEKAIKNENLYKTIVAHRLEFTKISGIDYTLHHPKTINPIPLDNVIKEWEKDYEKMKTEMLYGKDKPEFSTIIDTINKLKKDLSNLNFKIITVKE